MVYVVMRLYRQAQFINAVAAFDTHVNACKYVDQLDKGDSKYSYRVDAVHFNPQILTNNS
jgi:7,8-dihydro-6-hydroxymethylpterin-pyrophosphokinase